MKDNFWFNNPKILFKKDRLKEFFPIKEMSDIEKLNSIFRLSIYLGIILTIISNKYMYLYIIIITGCFTLFLYENKKEDFNNNFNIKNNVPNKNNPFMNYNIITDSKNKKQASKSYNSPTIKNEINSFFNQNLYRDVSDLYQKNNSQRQFYTMPCTEVVNKQTEFAKWLYYPDKTCKENGIKCASYNSM